MKLTLDHYEALRDGALREPDWMRRFHVHYKDAKRGPWTISQFDVVLGLHNVRLMRTGRGCFPGRYTRLVHEEHGIVMSDTTAEIADLEDVYKVASGRVLLNGLGLGCLLTALLTKPEVRHIDVMEIDQDILELIIPYFRRYAGRVQFHKGDVLSYKWPQRKVWDVIWHDIWNKIDTDNLRQMDMLIKRYGDKCHWQDCWCYAETKNLSREAQALSEMFERRRPYNGRV